MGSIVRCLLVGAGATAVGAMQVFSDWIEEQAQNMPEERRGPPAARAAEVFQSFKTSKKIPDDWTADRHPALVASLSSKDFAKQSQSEKKILSPGHLVEVLEEQAEHSEVVLPIFRYEQNEISAVQTNQAAKFVFAGMASQLHDPKARKDLLDGNYCWCDRFEFKTAASKEAESETQVLLSGTQDQAKCMEWRDVYLRGCAGLAAEDPPRLKPTHPYSDTPVFHFSEQGCTRTGDLMNLRKESFDAIREENFTPCGFYSIERTRLSGDRFTGVGVIATGTSDASICQKLRRSDIKVKDDRPPKT